MKKIIIVIGVVFLVACGNSSSQNKSSEFDDVNFKKVNIAFLDQEILIPNSYVEISPDDLKGKLLEIERESKFRSVIKEGIERLKLMPYDCVIYADKENYENCFWIHSAEYIDFDKNIATQYITMLEKQIGKDWTKLGLNYNRIEKRYLKSGKAKIIKVKYKQEYNGEEKFQTQYIVTKNNKSFGILVSNFENIDFEEIVKRI